MTLDTHMSGVGSGAREQSTASSGTPTAPSGAPRSPDFPFLAPPEQPDELGRLGSYRVLGVLGVGGMGVVFRAEDPILRRQIALKVMLPQFASKETAKIRFFREARAQAAVENDHVIAIHQVSEDRGVPYIAMPLLKGQSLAAALKANPAVPVSEAIRIAREMAAGLAAAHRLNLVHRDIKPANVWLEGSSRRVKILDFGLARGEPDADGSEPLTQTGAVIGTPAYMSPEQGRGLAIDARTDLWSLGVVLYQMTTRELPFRGATTMALLSSLALDTPVPPIAKNPAIAPALSDLVMRLLAKRVEDRTASAEAVVEALRGLETNTNQTAEVPVLMYAPAAVADPWESIANTEMDMGSSVEAHEPIADAAPVHPDSHGTDSSRSKLRLWALVASLLAFGGLAVVVADILKKNKNKDVSEAEVKTPDASTPATVPTPAKPKPEDLSKRPSPLDALRREDVSPEGLALAGGGDAMLAATDLVAVIREDGPPQTLRAVAVSPNGQTLAAGGRDSAIRLWDLAAWKPGQSAPPVRLLNGHTGEVWFVAFSPDGTRLASVGADGTVVLWDPATGKKIRDPLCRVAPECTVAFSPDGDSLVSGQANGSVVVYDARTGTQQVAWPAHASRPRAVAFSPDGKWLASGTESEVRVLVKDTGRTVQALNGGATRIAFSLDGATLLTTTTGTLRAWNCRTWEELRVPPSHTPVTLGALAVHPAGKLVATGAQNGTLIVRDVPTGRARLLASGGRGDAHRVADLAFTPEGRHLIVASGNGSLCVFRTPELSPIPNGPPSPRPIDLLALVDVNRDTIRGKWARRGTDLVATGNDSSLELPYQPPEEYDYIVQFATAGRQGVHTGVSFPYARSRAGLGAYFFDGGGGLCWIVASQLGSALTSGFGAAPNPETKQELRVEVRRATVRLMRNGNVWNTFWNAGQTPPPGHSTTRDGALPGLYTHQDATYHKAEVVELSGRGWYPHGATPAESSK